MKINNPGERLENSSGIPSPRLSLKRILDIVIEESRQLGGWGNTTYCVFMDQFFGHPERQDYKPVHNPLWPDTTHEYPHRLVEGVTPGGMFVVLRSMVRMNPDTHTQQCVAFTGDVKRREIRAWPITNIKPPTYYSRSARFVLSRAASISLLGRPRPQLAAVESLDLAQEGALLDVGDQPNPVIIAGASSPSFLGAAGNAQPLQSVAEFHRLVEAQKAMERRESESLPAAV